MAYINKKGYIERFVSCAPKCTNRDASVRDWFLVKYVGSGPTPGIHLGKYGYISFKNHKHLLGKRVMFKVEVLGEMKNHIEEKPFKNLRCPVCNGLMEHREATWKRIKHKTATFTCMRCGSKLRVSVGRLK